MNLDFQKAECRKAAARVRKEAAAALPDAGTALAGHIMGVPPMAGVDAASTTIGVYWPMGAEIDTRPCIDRLHAAGFTIALPVVTAPATPLTFRRWEPGLPLLDGGFGTSVPGPDAPEVVPDTLIVPLLAFDAAGYRLGYGGGFYDRTIEKLDRAGRAVTLIGAAFSAQHLDSVPHGAHDRKLHWVATETGVLQTSANERHA